MNQRDATLPLILFETTFGFKGAGEWNHQELLS
jgi:hypothetical protein